MSSRSAFTLLEMLIAASILAIILSAIALSFSDTLSSTDLDHLLQESSQVALYTEQVAALGYVGDAVADALQEEYGSDLSSAALLIGSFPYLSRIAGSDSCASGSVAHEFVSTLSTSSRATTSYTGALTFSFVTSTLTTNTESVHCFSNSDDSSLFIFITLPSLPSDLCISSLSGSGTYVYTSEGTSVCIHPVSVL